MNLPKQNLNENILTDFIALLLCFLLVLALASCGGKAEDAKKKKPKKKDTEISMSEDEKEETSANSNEAKEETSANKEETAKEDNSEVSSNKSEENSSANLKKTGKKETEKTEKAEKESKNDKEKKSDPKEAKSEEKAEKSPSADEIWGNLARGNKMFQLGKYTSGNLLSKRKILAKGQQPKVIILGCADSRVPPELIFGKSPGDLFVVRDAGNIVDEVSLGSIEYAVEHLKAKVIVVLGHESCGAVAATVKGEKMPTENLQAIVDTISPALEDSKKCPIGGEMNLDCVKLNVNQTAKNLISRSKIIKEASENGLVIIKAVYKLETGEVIRLE